jgi:hypothetical protein
MFSSKFYKNHKQNLRESNSNPHVSRDKIAFCGRMQYTHRCVRSLSSCIGKLRGRRTHLVAFTSAREREIYSNAEIVPRGPADGRQGANGDAGHVGALGTCLPLHNCEIANKTRAHTRCVYYSRNTIWNERSGDLFIQERGAAGE